MSVTLDKLQEMWEKDAKIDRDNLHEESLNVPSLHAKYFACREGMFNDSSCRLSLSIFASFSHIS